MVKFYCEVCDCHQPVEIEPLITDDLNKGKPPWGDIICTKCFFVIATVSASEPGVYRFEKVAGADLFDGTSSVPSRHRRVAMVYVGASIIAIVAARVHHLINNPHLTEAEALIFYLPLWLCAIAMALIGYIALKRCE
jgi:hypothetical protein